MRYGPVSWLFQRLTCSASVCGRGSGCPERLWDELKVEADVSDRHVDIVEVRPPWDGVGEHTRFPIARLRYTKSTGQWPVYWRDRNLKFHEYKRKRPTKNV